MRRNRENFMINIRRHEQRYGIDNLKNSKWKTRRKAHSFLFPEAVFFFKYTESVVL